MLVADPKPSLGATSVCPKEAFLQEMEREIPWATMAQIVGAALQRLGTLPPQVEVEPMVRLHCLQQWLDLTDGALEQALSTVPAYRHFAQLAPLDKSLPTQFVIRWFRAMLRYHQLEADVLHLVNAVLCDRGLAMYGGMA